MKLSILRSLFGLSGLILTADLLSRFGAFLALDVEPRALRPLNWIRRTFVSGPFGENGTLTYLAACAIFGALVFFVRNRAERGDENRSPKQRPTLGLGDQSDPASNEPGHVIGKGVAAQTTPQPTLNEIIASMNFDRVIQPQPAWQLVPLEPENDAASATSWIGGTPFAPLDFDWPTFSNGQPLMFLAQIDLAQVTAILGTGERPMGLPKDGALLFFLGFQAGPSEDDATWENTVRFFPATEVAQATHHATPSGAMSPRKLGLIWDEPALKRTPIRLQSMMDNEDIPLVSKFMGVEIGDPFGYHFPDGFQSLLVIKHDKAIGTASEHWQGMTIACPSADLARGMFDGGSLIPIHNG